MGSREHLTIRPGEGFNTAFAARLLSAPGEAFELRREGGQTVVRLALTGAIVARYPIVAAEKPASP